MPPSWEGEDWRVARVRDEKTLERDLRVDLESVREDDLTVFTPCQKYKGPQIFGILYGVS